MTRQDIVDLMPQLSTLRRQKLLTIVDWDKVDETTAPPGDALFLWVLYYLQTRYADWSNEQIDLMATTYASDMRGLGAAVEAAVAAGTEQPAVHLVVAERRYATMTGRTDFLDLESGILLDALPGLPVHTSTYNLVQLYLRYKFRLERRQANKD
jgi:hypothetical protein